MYPKSFEMTELGRKLFGIDQWKEEDEEEEGEGEDDDDADE